MSGEQELDSLDPKARAKMEHKRSLIRAGMGTGVDAVAEMAGFEIAKANSAADAMLGVRRKPYEVDGVEIADERDYGSDDVSPTCSVYSWPLVRRAVPHVETWAVLHHPTCS